MASALDALRARLAFVQSQTANQRPAVRKIHSMWIKDRKADFASAGSTTGHGRWRANAAATIARKGHGRVLFGMPSDGYQLHKSITDARHTDHVFKWTPGGKSVELGTKHWKARIHQLGLGRSGIVRRPVDPTNKQRRAYATVLVNWILKGKLP